MEEVTHKPCRRCGGVFPLSRFPRQKGSRDGHTHVCYECKNAKAKARYAVYGKPLSNSVLDVNSNLGFEPEASWKEIGEALGISRFAAQRLYCRAIEKIKKM